MTIAIKPEISISSLASEALSVSNGETDAAIAALAQRLSTDKKLRESIAAEAVANAIRQKIYAVHGHSRERLINAAQNGRDSVMSLATGLAKTMLDFPLHNGTSVRDASPEDLLLSIERYRSQASTMTRTANWLEAIFKLTPAQGKVGDVIDDATALRLFEEAGQ